MMVLMTLLAVTMMGNTAIDEKMAQNSQEQNRAFQAAETGIEMALADVNVLKTSHGFNDDGTRTDGAVVTNDVPSYSLVVGNPGKIIGKVNKYGKRKN